jgi:hypothetical protein
MLRVTCATSLIGSLLVTLSVSAGTSSMSPGQALVRINEAGELEMATRASKFVQEARTATRMVEETVQEQRIEKQTAVQDGKEVVVDVPGTVQVKKMRPEMYTYTVAVPVFENVVLKFPAATNGFRREADQAEIPLYDLAGNRLSVTAVESRLQDWTVVLTSPTGKALDRRFASIFKSTTIVVGVPPEMHKPMPVPIMQSPQPMIPRPQPVNPPAALPPPAAQKQPPRFMSPQSFVAFLDEDAAPRLPAAPPPTFAFAKVWGEKTLALRTEDEKTLDMTCLINKEVEKVHEGKHVKVIVCEPRQIEKVVHVQETLRYPLEDVAVTRTPNRELSKVELPTVLAYETLAVVSADGKPVDPLWQRNLRDGVLVIVPPAVPQGSYGAPPVMPAFGAPHPFPADAPPPPAPQAAPPPRPIQTPAVPAA